MDNSFLATLEKNLEGELLFDDLIKALYATDASVYRKLPMAVAYPKTVGDIKSLVKAANENGVGLIPRTAGTSLAGQCVGDGIIVDVSKHFTKIIDLDVDKKQIRVQPGVVRDELNQYLKPHRLFFGPNTSTANRCMIGGMVGNNSSGTTSIQYGVTRDKVVALQCVLSDGSEAYFSNLSKNELAAKTNESTLEAGIYNFLLGELSKDEVQKSIVEEFPKPEIHRRNTGYAVDELLKSNVFGGNTDGINLCKLLAGSEGTLAFTTEITLQLDDLPPTMAAMVCTHYHTLEDCLADVAPVMEHNLHTCEMMDKVILDCTKNNRSQLENRFFVEGDPAGILMLEVKAQSKENLDKQISELLSTIKKSGLSYASPVLYESDINKALELRKAGLGLLGNMVGDRKAVACIEDTAVALNDLKDFIGEFTEIMRGYGQEAVYYAHAGAGELHLRPILNLKKSKDVTLFRSITTEVAQLTKKYKGSFSGEHGDGIVRAEFIPLMIGDKNYELLKQIKSAFDPKNVFNPGKIVEAFPMDESLRYEIDRSEPEVSTLMDFSDSEGILKAAEKCNGSGDCRKSHHMSGGMCPSYQATKNEKDTTRARANALREFLTNSDKNNNFDHKELKEVFDLCLSCKACASECPSNVDVATLKAEFQFQYQEANGYSLRSKLFAHNSKLNALGSLVAPLTNAIYESKTLGGLLKRGSGVAEQRSLPKVYRFNFEKFLGRHQSKSSIKRQKVVLYIDEFTRFLDVEVGKDAIALLCGLGYEVRLFFAESGRTYLSKGYLKQAKKLVAKNMVKLASILGEDLPIVGLEPSSVLTFRDEYKRLYHDEKALEKLNANTYLLEEFLSEEIGNGKLSSETFTQEERVVKIHNHCHQKALSNQKITFDVLNLPKNYKVSIIPSGCCGMAGSFGYEKEHYETSMQVGELKLFPAVRKSEEDVIIAANGTSCRHQIFDGTGRKAKHPASILREALVAQIT
ncbi:FAD-binding and (Fe-S)-binding domain-containing protein [Flagellimonas allohymeniacidonis]|uniref:FAD-binding oxidoreductase n=1 Tax=Flagellimonas allohymeniacidonis TaxID=2517819 RepID=A0A4Q8QJI2_9FLAO|nr:FAD-binding and (Fe-S)-binding domain-containing protein [Allomuricauda hymeniacidonis]TAI48903.1 FAD-binding oxidoreductase [Allomuricauda hymeniacidonis]